MSAVADRSELKRRQKERSRAENKAKKAADAPAQPKAEKQISAADADDQLDAQVRVNSFWVMTYRY